MGRALREAMALFVGNFALIAGVVLTVWLPGNLLVNYLTFYVFDENSFAPIRVVLLIEGVFGPLVTAAIVFAIWERKHGRPVGYAGAMWAGLKNWANLFVVQLVAGLIIVLGCVALIVPGIILAVRYALISPVAVLERAGAGEARRRSVLLTKGVRWQILGGVLLIFVAVTLIYFMLLLVIELVPVRPMALTVVADCISDILFELTAVLMVVYYMRAVEQEAARAALDAPPAAELAPAIPPPLPETAGGGPVTP